MKQGKILHITNRFERIPRMPCIKSSTVLAGVANIPNSTLCSCDWNFVPKIACIDRKNN